VHREGEGLVDRASSERYSEDDNVSPPQVKPREKMEQSHLKQAKMLVDEGASVPSSYKSHADDLNATSDIITGFAGAVILWPSTEDVVAPFF
jgi:hypothetical protein